MKKQIKDLLREGLLKGLITEGASPILYHFTNINRLNNILDTNALYLIPVTTRKEESRGRNYFASFSRTKSTKHGYGVKYSYENSVRIKIDGVKLGQNYKVISVDYWQSPRTPEYMYQGRDEMEDRVISNNNEIPNINKYIISIDVFTNGEVSDALINNAKKLGVSLNFYNNKRDFTNGNPDKGISPKVKGDDSLNNKDNRPSNFGLLGVLTYKNSDLLVKLLNDFKVKFGYDDNLISSITEYITKYHEKLDYHLRPNDNSGLWDLSSSLGTDLHNSKTSSDKFTRYVVKFLMDDFKKTGSSSIIKYLESKLYSGKKTQGDFNNEFNSKILGVINRAYKGGIDELDYSVYNNDMNWDSLYQYEPAKKFLDNKLQEIKNYVSDYVLNNDDMYKYSYLLGTSNLKDKLDLKDDNAEANKIANTLEDVRGAELMRPLQMVVWEIDDFYYDEVKRMQDENNSQWKK
jgi:hypothetical protein